MKIHSDILTVQDICDAVPFGCYLAAQEIKPGHVSTVVRAGSRKRDHAFIVRLSGSSKSTMQRLSDKAASWDEWGNFLAALFAIDSNAVCGSYESYEDFMAKTRATYERVSRYRPDLGISAPWL